MSKSHLSGGAGCGDLDGDGLDGIPIGSKKGDALVVWGGVRTMTRGIGEPQPAADVVVQWSGGRTTAVSAPNGNRSFVAIPCND